MKQRSSQYDRQCSLCGIDVPAGVVAWSEQEGTTEHVECDECRAKQTVDFSAYVDAHGVYPVAGVEYVALDNPMLTNHVFPGWWGDVGEGESYISQWSCPAAAKSDFGHEDFDPSDLSNAPVTLVFEFPAIKGQEPDDDSDWPWDDSRYISAKRA